MFNALKEKAVAKAVELFEADLRVRIQDKIELFQKLKPADVYDDALYTRLVIQPLWLYVKMQSSGAITALQKVMSVDVEQRFKDGLFMVRNDLIKTDGANVTLVPDFNERVGPTLIKAFQAKAA